jgi:Protein of unknown function (DUF3604)
MRVPVLKLSFCLLLGLAGLGVLGPPPVWAQAPASLADDSVVSFRVRFGVTDTAERKWDGALTLSNGELLGLRDWRPRPENVIQPPASWELSTHRGLNFHWRPWEDPPSTGPAEYYWAPGVIVDVRASAGTRLNFRTEQGRFSFNPRDISAGSPAAMLDGAVIVDRVAPAELLSNSDYQNDFATMLSGSDGEVWAAWVAYRNGADEVLARRFDGTKWEEAQTVTEKPGDIYLAKMGRDGSGRVWVVWSEQVGGNWDLYARSLARGEWSSVTRLTADAQPDIFPNVATDSKGTMWVVWQGFREGQSDIFARRFDGSSWSDAERVSNSEANDWEPVVATDSKGRAYVAWDTYDKGNYDVMLRSYAAGEWSEPVAVAATPNYEAHVSLATDKQDRLWAAWNESGMNWGKDTGFMLNNEGTRLYAWRTIAVAVYDGAKWQVPVSDINRALPAELQEYNDFPQLYTDAVGKVWLFARHRNLRIRDTQSEAPAHRASWETWGTTLDGDRWITPLAIPFTNDRTDVRWGLASDGRGNVFAAWPTDNRDYEEFLFQRADVYAAKLPKLDGATRPPRLAPRVVPELTFYPIHTHEAEDLAKIHDYRIESEGKTYHIYRGDTHRHSEFSMDGNNDGSLLQVYRYAIDAARLDYLLQTEHNGAGGPDIEYINWVLQQTADVLTVPGRFQPFYGYERSVVYPNGHRNILFAKRGNPTLPIPEAEQNGEQGAEELYKYLKRYNGIAISHTSATTMGTDWRDNDPEVEPLVEIYQGDRVSAEYEGAPRAANADNPKAAPGSFRPAGYVWNAWAKGYKLGVQAASDHLSTHISYACTIAEEFTLDGMMDAMKKRHSYGATDNIILDYRLQADGREYLQGDVVTAAGNFRLLVRVVGTTPIRQVDIIKDQTFLHNRQNQPQELSFEFMDNDVTPGEHYYYVRVIQNDGNMAWSSPIWVTRR